MVIKESAEEIGLRIEEIMRRLDAHYGEKPPTFLKYNSDWQLLFATMLSAQCTDERVNRVTETLWKKYTDIRSLAECTQEELEEDIRSTGFFHNKAKNIRASARMILERYHGRVPDTLEELIRLPGVGRKTANLILGHIYHQSAIVVDTHVKRVSNRLGLAASDDPEKTEYQLMEVLPEEYWIRWNTHIISLGRSYCRSARPLCEACYLQDICPAKNNAKLLQETRSSKSK